MSWNPVLNRVLDIKKRAAAAAGSAGTDLFAYDGSMTSLEYWISLAGSEEDRSLLPFLYLTEYEDLLLIKYANLGDIMTLLRADARKTAGADDSEEEPEISGDKLDAFWDSYDGFFRECRSVVIDIRKDCLVLTPFRTFRNLNEGEETSYENVQKRIENASCVEFSNKLDGSMQTARFYDGRVVMAGSQALDRENSWRLADGWRMLEENDGYTRMLQDHPDHTFIFEYISEKDAHVVKYDKEGLFLIGIRNVLDGTEASYREILAMAERYGIPTTEVFDKTLDEVVAELDTKQSSEAEGFVVNIDGFKVKINTMTMSTCTKYCRN